ncbi:MAG TPA: hypothetical protein VF432_21820 [Thermoanaerobaculia bacterium]
MTRRLWLCAVILSLVALPALARRRAIMPRGPGACAPVTLAQATYAALFATDGQFFYFVDEMGVLSRVPKLGGEVQPLADPFEEWLPLSIAVDETHVYIGALPLEALFIPSPGVILTVPKGGGVAGVLASGVSMPLTLALDATHLYWAAAGTFDFNEETIASDGKIERITKDGAVRDTLASDLSVPIGLALDATDVYFGESGSADDDDSVGLFRVAKSGGAVVTVAEEVAVGPLVLDGNTLVLLGSTPEAMGVLAVEKSGASPVRVLYSSELIEAGLRVADRRAYFLQAAVGPGSELAWVSVDAPAEPVSVRNHLDGDDFLLDGCAAIVNTVDGDVVRTAR